MEIVQLKESSPAILADINNLLKQLRSSVDEQVGTLDELEGLVKNGHAVVMVVKDGPRIVGMGTLFILANVGLKSGDIEDVVVDEVYRRQGLGKGIMSALVNAARDNDLKQLYLTSRSSRVTANKLYPKLGFELRETNVYRLKL